MHQHVLQLITVFQELKLQLLSVVIQHAQIKLLNQPFMQDKISMLSKKLTKQDLKNGRLEMLQLLLLEMELIK